MIQEWNNNFYDYILNSEKVSDYFKLLSKEEIDEVECYAGNSHKIYNAILRRNEYPPSLTENKAIMEEHYNNKINKLIKAVNNYSLGQELLLHRLLSIPENKIKEDFRVGSVYHEKSFLSTSLSSLEDLKQDFKGNMFMKILYTPDIKALPVGHISHRHFEREILLQPNLWLRVVDIVKIDGIYHTTFIVSTKELQSLVKDEKFSLSKLNKIYKLFVK